VADKVKLSKDGSSIDFVQSESIPTSIKKFRQSPEIEGFYRFIYENDLQKEAYEILERIVNARKAKKKSDKQEAAQAVKLSKPSAPKKNEVTTAKVDTKKPAPPKKEAKIPAKKLIAKKEGKPVAAKANTKKAPTKKR
jgi:hypothetical protein